MGFVDLHCHILWDLDSEAAPTPHVQARYGGGDAELSQERLEQARVLLASEGVGLVLHPGGENVLDDDFVARAGSDAARGLGEGGRYVLVELPFQAEVPGLPDLLLLTQARGVTPILAHPERCLEFERKGRAAEAVRLGAALQLNLGSLIGRHGRCARKLAESFLDEGLYAVAATDLHSPEGADEWIAQALETLAERAGRAYLLRLCDENPRRALAGQDLS